MRTLRVLAVLFGAVLAVAVLAAWLVPQLLDWNDYRPPFATIASAGLGRPVRIEGPIRLSLLPQRPCAPGWSRSPTRGTAPAPARPRCG